MPAPGAGNACSAVTDRANMTVCNAPACSPACLHPVRFVAGDGRRRPGYWWHDWSGRR